MIYDSVNNDKRGEKVLVIWEAVVETIRSLFYEVIYGILPFKNYTLDECVFRALGCIVLVCS